MGKISVKKGSKVHSIYENVGTIEIVLSGSVRATDGNHSFTLGGGGIIGCLETSGSSYIYNYEALEDAVVFSYAYTKPSDIEKVIASNQKILPNLAAGAIRMYMDAIQSYQKLVQEASSLYHFVMDTYSGYTNLCQKFKVPMQTLSYMDELEAFAPENEVHAWEIQYFSSMRSLDAETKKGFYGTSIYAGIGLTMQAISATKNIMIMVAEVVDYLSELSSYVISGNAGDFFDLYSNLMSRASTNPFADTTPIEAAVSKMIIYMTDSHYIDVAALHSRVSDYRAQLREIEERLLMDDDEMAIEKDAYEALDRSMETIFDYAGMDPEEREDFRDLIEKYKLIPDKNSTDDDARRLRRSISDRFYRVYEKAFFNSVSSNNIPTVIKMFFNFGYIDEELCGMSNASQLFEMAKNMKPDPKGNVVTVYEWLKYIYEGKAEPSKNEFDLDYPGYLREQKNSGDITEAQEKNLLYDRSNKVKFEIANLFTIGNRITFGRLTTFCPLLSEHNILRPLQSAFLSPEKVYEALDEIRKVDFSCFYRPVVYTNPKIGIQREYIDVEVLPHIILMPNLGTRGSLWQETADSRRDSQGRILMSIFPMENVKDMLIKLSGEFRWELCKKIQGVHWNDVTDPSLTSEYSDYIQFYKKNRELSNDVRERIKAQMQKAKNNYRDMFVMDYVNWIKYEGNSSPRLNKYVRAMMFRYCPFSAEVRATVASNPLYAECLEKYSIKQGQKRHTLELVFSKLKSTGFDVPSELQLQRAYLDK